MLESIRRFFWLELAVGIRGVWSAPPQRRKRPFQPRRFWWLVAFTGVWEIGVGLLAIGAMRPLGTG